MKKIFILVLMAIMTTSFAHAFPMVAKRCVGADIKKENLSLVLSILQKNHLKYRVIKHPDWNHEPGTDYRVIVKAHSEMKIEDGKINRYIGSQLTSLMNSEIMHDFGIEFRRTMEGQCQEIENKGDLTTL